MWDVNVNEGDGMGLDGRVEFLQWIGDKRLMIKMGKGGGGVKKRELVSDEVR